MWEKAIKLSKELAETYESKVFDYEGLGNLLVSRAQHAPSPPPRPGGAKASVHKNVSLHFRKSG